MVVSKVAPRLPNYAGTFQIVLFRDHRDGKEHIALVRGDLKGKQQVLTRIHSEWFTGDTLYSNRCDCHDQLYQALERIGRETEGVLIYLRQEECGIGPEKKRRAYQLQDQSDMVEANRQLGRADDERSCEMAALILNQLGVQSIRLLTNNPRKIKGLRQTGIQVTERIPLPGRVTDQNRHYLETKQDTLDHFIQSPTAPAQHPETPTPRHVLQKFRQMQQDLITRGNGNRPAVTASFAQSLDGSIALIPSESFTISCREALQVTHGLRAMHDAILIGIGTLLADDPRLTVRFEDGHDPRPVIVDSTLRIPETCKILQSHPEPPLLATTELAETGKVRAIEKLGAEILLVKATSDKRVDLRDLLATLARRNISSVMVEGGSQILTSFFIEKLVDMLVITIAPLLLGGVRGIGPFDSLDPGKIPVIHDLQHMPVGEDLIVWGKVR